MLLYCVRTRKNYDEKTFVQHGNNKMGHCFHIFWNTVHLW